MATAITGTYMTATQGTGIAYGTLTLSGNYGGSTTNGDTLDLTKYQWQGMGLNTTVLPISVTIQETTAAGTAAGGYTYLFSPGTTLANGVVQVLQPQGSLNPQTQITGGSAYPAGAIVPLLVTITYYAGI